MRTALVLLLVACKPTSAQPSVAPSHDDAPVASVAPTVSAPPVVRLEAGTTARGSARVLLVRGKYMSVNSWFRADRTTHVIDW